MASDFSIHSKESNDFELNIPIMNEDSICSTSNIPEVKFCHDNRWKIEFVPIDSHYNIHLRYNGKSSVMAKVRMEISFVDAFGSSKWDTVCPTEFKLFNSSAPMIINKVQRNGTVSNMLCNYFSALIRIYLKVFIELQPSNQKRSLENTTFQSVSEYLQSNVTEFSDVSVICADGSRIPAYKLILAAQSDVLRAMLTTSMSESTTNEIVISDFEPAVVKTFLAHLTGITQLIESDEVACCELFEIAHKYGVTRLMKSCEQFLLSSINTDNAIDLLLFSDRYDLSDLKKSVLGIIVREYDTISVTDRFGSLPTEMYLNIMHHMKHLLCCARNAKV